MSGMVGGHDFGHIKGEELHRYVNNFRDSLPFHILKRLPLRKCGY